MGYAILFLLSTNVHNAVHLSLIHILQNDGVESFLKNKLPRLPWHETPVIANLYATSPAEFAELAGILAAEEGIAGLEVNISCPNVKNGGVLFGQDPALAAEVTQAVKKHAGNLPVIVKPVSYTHLDVYKRQVLC